MSAPLIGITTSRTPSQYGYPLLSVAENYVRALAQAGANPVLIPLGLPEATLLELAERLDGILFSGGGDVQPDRYGGPPHSLVNFVDEDRDRVEIQLVQDTIHQGRPFLGICRGLQVINVALGGGLYEDISDQRPQSLRHDNFPGNPRDFLAHSVQIQEESRLKQILGTNAIQVNSMHHQGINHLASGLLATAFAPDGIVEAFELPNYAFGLAVQWHPEWLLDQPEMRALFRAFVQAAKASRTT